MHKTAKFNSALRSRPGLLLFAATLLLGGCSNGGYSDLDEHMNAVRSRPAGHIAPLPEFETYESFHYEADELRDPFAPREEEAVANNEQSSAGNGIQPNLNRHKEALEQFPLDAISYVGVLERNGQTWAILQAPDGFVHRAAVGNYLGQNNGEIRDISESEIRLIEIVQDGLGGWVERQATLVLKE